MVELAGEEGASLDEYRTWLLNYWAGRVPFLQRLRGAMTADTQFIERVPSVICPYGGRKRVKKTVVAGPEGVQAITEAAAYLSDLFVELKPHVDKGADDALKKSLAGFEARCNNPGLFRECPDELLVLETELGKAMQAIGISKLK